MIEKKSKIGISISTRNRADLLKIGLEKMHEYLSPELYDYVIVVVNDDSTEEWKDGYKALKKQYSDVIFHNSKERLGIAGAKNKGIKTLRDNKVDHYFLWDDDAWPKKKGWDQYYIETAKNGNTKHLMHQFELPGGDFKPIWTHDGISEFNKCAGVLLYFDKVVIEKLGGYPKRMGIYGYEHFVMSKRCNIAGLMGNWGPMISPENTREYIYSLDLDLNNWGVQPEGMCFNPGEFKSSMPGEDIGIYIQYNNQFMNGINMDYEEI